MRLLTMMKANLTGAVPYSSLMAAYKNTEFKSQYMNELFMTETNQAKK